MVDPVGGNFHLTATTSKGAPLASPYDKDPDGKLRGSDGVWDLGAYEFGGIADTQPPVVAISSPVGGMVSGIVNLGANASDNSGGSGIASVAFLVDNVTVGTVSVAPYSYNWDSKSIANGSHAIQARAVDQAGNQAFSATVTVNVQNAIDVTGPAVAINSPTSGASIRGQISLAATASDNVGGSGVAQVSFTVDGITIGVGTASGNTYTLPWNTFSIANGPHALRATARDVAGNQATSATVDINVQNPALDLLSGIAAYWKADEPAGNTVEDSSANGNTGTAMNGLNRGTGKIDGGLQLDGIDDYVDVSGTQSLEISGSIALSAWIKPDQNGGWQSVIRKLTEIGSHTYPFTAYDLILVDTGAGTFQPRMDVSGTDGNRVSATGNELAYGSWYHIGGVYDGSTLQIYVNGVVISSTPYSSPLLQTGQPLYLGVNGALGDAFKGVMDDIRIYNRALSSSEIQSLYGARVPNAPTSLRITAN